MKRWPTLSDSKNDSLKTVLDFMTRERLNDINDRNTFPQIFVGGRKVNRVPSASTDVESGDTAGDFNVTTSYAYWCINNAGTVEWVRVAVGTF